MFALTGYRVRDTLKRLFHFRLLNDEQLDALGTIFSIQKYKTGELIFSQDEDAVAFYTVLGGKIQSSTFNTEPKVRITGLWLKI